MIQNALIFLNIYVRRPMPDLRNIWSWVSSGDQLTQSRCIEIGGFHDRSNSKVDTATLWTSTAIQYTHTTLGKIVDVQNHCKSTESADANSLKAQSHSTRSRCKLLRLAEIHNIVRVAASWSTHNYYNDGLARYLPVINNLLAITYQCCCDLERS